MSIHFIICFIYCPVAQSCTTLCDTMKCNMPGFPVLHYLLEFAQTQVHWVGDATQPSHLLLSPSPPSLNLSQHQDNFQWVHPSHQVAKVFKLQLRHQSFQWIFTVDSWSGSKDLTSHRMQPKKEKKKINEINNVYPVFFKAILLGFKMWSESHKSCG